MFHNRFRKWARNKKWKKILPREVSLASIEEEPEFYFDPTELVPDEGAQRSQEEGHLPQQLEKHQNPQRLLDGPTTFQDFPGERNPPDVVEPTLQYDPDCLLERYTEWPRVVRELNSVPAPIPDHVEIAFIPPSAEDGPSSSFYRRLMDFENFDSTENMQDQPADAAGPSAFTVFVVQYLHPAMNILHNATNLPFGQLLYLVCFVLLYLLQCIIGLILGGIFYAIGQQ